jgi:hypothetical protein
MTYSISKKGNKLETQMIPAIAIPKKESPLLFEGLTWREFKAVEQLLDRPRYRLSFIDGILEIRRMPGEPHETVKERIGALLEFFLLMAGFDFTRPQHGYELIKELEARRRRYNRKETRFFRKTGFLAPRNRGFSKDYLTRFNISSISDS